MKFISPKDSMAERCIGIVWFKGLIKTLKCKAGLVILSRFIQFASGTEGIFIGVVLIHLIVLSLIIENLIDKWLFENVLHFKADILNFLSLFWSKISGMISIPSCSV